MPRISNTDIPENKHIVISLTYIYGIGRVLAERILKKAKIDCRKKTSLLNNEELSRLRNIIQEEYKTEGRLREEIRSNISRLKEIHSYRGLRHSRNLPTRGQNTRQNARTVRGNVRRTVATGQRKATAKT
ncbi:30S ribosomal protein S13 [bacterium]|nr:MAG: 30S ribosomal protein S13 [bacterium]